MKRHLEFEREPAPPVNYGSSGRGLRTATSVPTSTGSALYLFTTPIFTWGFQMNSGTRESQGCRRDPTGRTRGPQTGRARHRRPNRHHG